MGQSKIFCLCYAIWHKIQTFLHSLTMNYYAINNDKFLSDDMIVYTATIEIANEAKHLV